MKRVKEYELWSQPGHNLSKELGKQLTRKVIKELKLDADVFLGLSFLPSETDVENLKTSIAENEINISSFNSYCSNQRLSNTINNAESASLFLEYHYGRPLAWLHITDDKNGKKNLMKLYKWVKLEGFVIVEPDYYYCLVI